MKSSPFVHRLPPILAALACAFALSACGSGEEGSGATQGGPEAAGDALVDWPYFGRVPERTHYLPTEEAPLDPPLRQAWSINTHALIEFPPAIGDGVAYVVNKYGNAKAVRLADRKVLWEKIRDPKEKGKPADVTAPLYHQGLVIFADIDGHLVALSAEDGHQVWDRNLHAHLESSPVAVDGVVYLGDDGTNVVALRAADGKVLWEFNSPAAIKASPSYHDGRVCVGDYEGSVFCLDAKTGKPIWRVNTTRQAPFGEGGFYSSPAIDFGRIYAARDDGTIYAFDFETGKVAWHFSTGRYIYGSPATAAVPGTPPTVYIGGYDSHLYALDATTGKVRWRADVGGPVPGTATVVGHTVYTSSFKTDETIGIDVRTHRRTFHLKQAGYTPMVSDGRRLFLIGYFDLIGLEPKRR